jgi:hypothetical protein
MTTVNYPSPVQVNGYSCKNCTEVDEAKKHIDPAHPKDGPYGVDAKTRPPSPGKADPTEAAGKVQSPAFVLGGALAGLSPASGAATAAGASTDGALGRHLNVSI